MEHFSEIKRKSVIGGAVTLGSQGAKVVIQIISTVVLSRLLPPSDFGVLAMITAFTAFAGLFRDMGLSAAAIQQRDLTSAQVSTLFWLNATMGALLTGLLALAAPLVGWFYGRPELVSITLALSTTFFIAGLGTQHGAALQRNMAFGRKALADIGGILATVLVSAILALLGYGYWALALGTICGSLVSTICLIALCPIRIGLPAKDSGVRHMLGFGADVTGFEFINYFHRNLDNILIGHFWGSNSLGLYNRAYQLLLFPIQNLRGPINAVAFPAMSKLRERPQAFRDYYRKVTSFLAFLSMPLTAYMAVNAEQVIEILLGKRWLGAAPIFSMLAIASFIQPVASLRGMVLLSTGQSRRYLYWGIFNAAFVSAGFFVGIRWGSMGVAASYAIVNYLLLYPSLRLAFAKTPLTTADFFLSIVRPVISSLVAMIVSFAALIKVHGLPIVELTISLLVFSCSYLGVFAALPGGFRELTNYVRLRQYLGRPEEKDG